MKKVPLAIAMGSIFTIGDAQAESWTDRLEVGGVIEIEGFSTEDFAGNDSSDIVVATAELGIIGQINDMVEAELTFLYEENDTPLETDVARIGISTDNGWGLDFGQVYVPFGVFETNMVSDTLTLEIGETRETVAMASFGNDILSAGAYVFNGDTTEAGDDDEIDGMGVFAGLMMANFEGTVGYINDITDADSITDTIGNTVTDSVSAFTVSGIFTMGDITLIGEYLAADDFAAADLAFNGVGAEPAAFNVEAGYTFDLSGKEATAAIGYQETEEAVALGLPEERVSLALSVGIMKNTSLAIEWAADEDYSVADGGTGGDADTFTAQLAVEF